MPLLDSTYVNTTTTSTHNPSSPHAATSTTPVGGGQPLPTVQVHALSAGHFSLPEEQFVFPFSPGSRRTVPSLCFLIQHSTTESQTTRIVFDLGLRRDLSRYSAPIQQHLATRQPLDTHPDVVTSLRRGGLGPEDINFVIYSHVHWDHVGEPRDFPSSTFIVGYGSLNILSGISHTSLRGGHSFFENDLLDQTRTIELLDPEVDNVGSNSPSYSHHADGHHAGEVGQQQMDFSQPWTPISELNLPLTLDVFGDGSLYIVDAPGHLPGHINLLARTKQRWVYLAGDSCHDRRIMSREKEIGEWEDAQGNTCCIHANRSEAEETIERIRGLERAGVEVIFSHDGEWEQRNQHRFFGAPSRQDQGGQDTEMAMF
ncbi:beta-lactamase-like protein [Podospora australis]|uniref:Beta-lactamase-like protein n=1 Tax=Podospora australis TaxID=1536484 RepID=A0AAN6WSZ8_9PEZI|nr:beta-lactamase-like protein [Podospora australis]